jgi:hypothetical protein
VALASTYAMAGGAAVGTVGSYYSALGEKTALGFQADLDAINARIADRKARDSLARGEREYGAHRLKTAAFKGQQRTELAANNVDLGFGSAAAVLASTDLLGDVDAETILANASREAWGHRLEAVGLRGSSAVNRASAKAINPGMEAAGSLLTSAGTVASHYYGLKETGAIKPGKPSHSRRPSSTRGSKY